MNSLSQLIPWSALLGGMVIGMAITILIRFNGKIAGVSGIVGGLFNFKESDVVWRVVFILGLLVAPSLWQLFFTLPDFHIKTDYGLLVLAGLMVGFGARYGSGCTSGHGVCGVARMSPRSIVATLIFISTAIITVYFVRHLTFT